LENEQPAKIAYDRPSPKFLSFLARHFNLRRPVQQANNYVIFKEFGLRTVRAATGLRRPLKFLTKEPSIASSQAIKYHMDTINGFALKIILDAVPPGGAYVPSAMETAAHRRRSEDIFQQTERSSGRRDLEQARVVAENATWGVVPANTPSVKVAPSNFLGMSTETAFDAVWSDKHRFKTGISQSKSSYQVPDPTFYPDKPYRFSAPNPITFAYTDPARTIADPPASSALRHSLNLK
jgi:hypothetical protein